MLEDKSKTLPILSFPGIALSKITVKELVTSSSAQAHCLNELYKRCNMASLVTPMDLSVEAECFGAPVRFSDNDVPSVERGIIDSIEDVGSVSVPEIGAGRSGIYIEGTKMTKAILPDVPLFCGAIGPYSLAGRLFDMTELMMECYDSPDEVKKLLDKATEFIIHYINAHKNAGADGVILAEPAAGLLSPALCDEFSNVYVKRIIDAVSDDSFVFCYHNCGSSVIACAEGIASLGADIYHFGNAIELESMIPKMPEGSIVMGNVDPLLLRDGTESEVCASIDTVFSKCAKYTNFMISTGCDVPADAKWENIDAYFRRINELYV